jgi:Tol biopolymer transport system component
MPRRASHLGVIDHRSCTTRLIFETPMHIEAPNWSGDGMWIVFNGDGRLWRIPAGGGHAPEPIDTGTVCGIGNDHLFSPDGRSIYFTANGIIYCVSQSGCAPRQISHLDGTEQVLLFLHGISSDGRQLACTGFDARSGRTSVRLLLADGGCSQCIADFGAAIDGPEFSADGRWIYFNSEIHARRPGDMQLFRMHTEDSRIEQLTADDRVNWFPHLSPDGASIAYLSYPRGTTGHPAGRNVLLRCLDTRSRTVRDMARVFGGQGTLNANSWSPDSAYFAFVAYS